MGNYVNNLIEYTGITDAFPDYLTVFKQFNIQETTCLPIAKPNMQQIIKIMAEVVITSTKVIRSPDIVENSIVSLEGQKLTGWKLLVEGKIRQKVEYIVDEPTQPVHAVHFSIPFSTFIILGEDYVLGSPLVVSGYIEDIFAKLIDERCIFNNIVILVTVE